MTLRFEGLFFILAPQGQPFPLTFGIILNHRFAKARVRPLQATGEKIKAQNYQQRYNPLLCVNQVEKI